MARVLFFLVNLSVTKRLVFVNIASLVVLGAILFAVAYNLVAAEMERQGVERQETSMRVAWEVLSKVGQPYAVKDGKMYAGDVELNENFAVVDRVKEIVGGTATIFMGDTRITTNVMKPDGSGRAVGTKLAKNAAYDAVLGQGKPFRGTVDILGQAFFTGYDPIKDSEGKTIGILYVGVKKADFFAVVDRLLSDFAMALGIAVVLLTLLAILLNKLALKPLARIRQTLESLIAGQRPAVPYVQRSDEIGVIARALVTFGQSMEENAKLQAQQAEAQAVAEAERKKLLEKLAGTFTESVGKLIEDLSRSAGTMRGDAEALSAASQRLTDLTGRASSASERASGGIDNVAGTANALSSAIAAALGQVTETSDSAQKAVGNAELTNDSVKTLAAAANRIGEVVQLINDIAAQTNGPGCPRSPWRSASPGSSLPRRRRRSPCRLRRRARPRSWRSAPAGWSGRRCR